MLETLMYGNVWIALAVGSVIYWSAIFWSFRLGQAAIRFNDTSARMVNVRRFANPQSRGKSLIGFLFNWWIGVCSIPILWAIAFKLNSAALFSAWMGAITLPFVIVNITCYRSLMDYHIFTPDQLAWVRDGISRRATNRSSAVAYLSYAALFLFLFVITGSWYFIGGVMFIIVQARKLWRTPEDRGGVAQASEAINTK